MVELIAQKCIEVIAKKRRARKAERVLSKESFMTNCFATPGNLQRITPKSTDSIGSTLLIFFSHTQRQDLASYVF